MAKINEVVRGLLRYGHYITDETFDLVCRITAAGRFVRMWDGYSATTMRHVNSFLSLYDVAGGGKAWWNALPVEEKPHYSMAADMTPAESLKAMYNRRAASNMNY